MIEAIQKIIFGTKINKQNFSEEQFEILKEYDGILIKAIYNGNYHLGCLSEFIGFDILVLKDDGLLNLSDFIENFDFDKNIEKYKKEFDDFKNSDFFEKASISEENKNIILNSFGKPKLFIVAETM